MEHGLNMNPGKASVAMKAEPPPNCGVRTLKNLMSKKKSVTAVVSSERVRRRPCVICGARVVNTNPKTNTCDSICTRAKHAGRTRQEQIEYEMDIDGHEDYMAHRAHMFSPTDEPGVKRRERTEAA